MPLNISLPTGTADGAAGHTAGHNATNTAVNSVGSAVDVLMAPNVVATDATSVAINAALGGRFKVTIGGNRTLGNPANAYDGQLLVISVKQDATGGRTVTLDTKYRLPNGTSSLSWSTTAGRTDHLLVKYDSVDDKFDVLSFAPGYGA